MAFTVEVEITEKPASSKAGMRWTLRTRVVGKDYKGLPKTTHHASRESAIKAAAWESARLDARVEEAEERLVDFRLAVFEEYEAKIRAGQFPALWGGWNGPQCGGVVE